ncbi:hypothetical protein FF38_02491 [Lucilia cuprina]|uniref:Uncharacterized protein n=1 Tax=Lucilia cuprina TaxID=7375 RepID=A0A0L0C5W3_LUCCU|nr:hypothetical protein FF38_02491 [Lucilia cuprina]
MDILDNFEKPKAQVYYKHFAEQKNLCVEWKQVRSKVRNMRVSYNKAKAWEGSTGAGRMKATLLKMCYYYDELDDIFGSKIIETAVIEESLDEESDGSFLNSTEIYVDDTTTASDSSLPETKQSCSRKDGNYGLKKMEHEKEIKEREIAIRENEIKIKERELELKMKELETQKELKIMELQMKERLATEELRLKHAK